MFTESYFSQLVSINESEDICSMKILCINIGPASELFIAALVHCVSEELKKTKQNKKHQQRM